MAYLFLIVIEYLILYTLARRISLESYQVFYRMTKSEKLTIYLYSILFLPGTFIHEASHAIIATILLVRVKGMSFIPVVENKRIKLGSVMIVKTDPFRSTVIGIAPFILGNLILYLLINFGLKNTIYDSWILIIFSIYIIFEIGNTMFSSREDLRSAIFLVILISLVIAVLYLLGIRISVDLKILFSENIVLFLKTLSIFLLLPIFTDLVIIVLFKTLGFKKIE